MICIFHLHTSRITFIEALLHSASPLAHTSDVVIHSSRQQTSLRIATSDNVGRIIAALAATPLPATQRLTGVAATANSQLLSVDVHSSDRWRLLLKYSDVLCDRISYVFV
jgi:hypothetical protein